MNIEQGPILHKKTFQEFGLLRPLDGILPYRLEGHVELPSGVGENMFG